MLRAASYPIAGIVLCAAILSGCGGGAPSTPSSAESSGAVTAAKGVPDAEGNVPFEVFRRAVMAANSGDFAGAEKYILTNSAMGTAPNGKNVMPEKWPIFTHGGNVAKIEFISDDYNGFSVHLEYRLTYADGTTFHEFATLDKEKGFWKIAFLTRDTPI